MRRPATKAVASAEPSPDPAMASLPDDAIFQTIELSGRRSREWLTAHIRLREEMKPCT